MIILVLTHHGCQIGDLQLQLVLQGHLTPRVHPWASQVALSTWQALLVLDPLGSITSLVCAQCGHWAGDIWLGPASPYCPLQSPRVERHTRQASSAWDHASIHRSFVYSEKEELTLLYNFSKNVLVQFQVHERHLATIDRSVRSAMMFLCHHCHH